MPITVWGQRVPSLSVFKTVFPIYKKDEDISGTPYEQYAENIEEKLSALISQIDGAGEAKVMVTLECSDESVYAREQKSEDGGETNRNRTPSF